MFPVLEVTSRCIACDNCRLICPEKAILVFEQKYVVDPWPCTLCGICSEVCPTDALKIKLPEDSNHL